MTIIGLCGNSGSGKGTVCESFFNYGIPSIDADIVYRDLTVVNSTLTQELSDKFGSEILNTDLSLNRKALADIVFSDKSGGLLRQLNKITHSSIIAETERRIAEMEKNGITAVVFDAPLLFESEFDKKCDFIIAVTANKNDKIQRIMQRDGIDYKRADARISSQLSEEFLIEHSDYVIENTGSVDDLNSSVQKIIKNIFNCEV